MWATLFQYFCYSFSAVCQNCWILAAQTKTSLQKTFFLKKSHIFSNHFQLQSKVFRTFEQLFSSGLSNLTFVSPDEFSLGKWVSFGKSSPWNFFRNLLEWRLEFLLIFFSRDVVKNAVNVSKTPFEKKFSVKKCLLKFFRQLWGRFSRMFGKRDLKSAF